MGMELSGVGEKNSGYILCLNVSLYGVKQPNFNWHQKLKQALEDRGFRESLSDPCVFLSPKMIVLSYVDDCILISRDESIIEKFIQSLSEGQEKFIFTDEGAIFHILEWILLNCLTVQVLSWPNHF